MGKKVLRVGAVALMVGVVAFAVINAVLFLKSGGALEKKSGPQGLALEARNGFAESVDETLGGKEAALGMAYLVGMKDGLDEETQDILKLVGLTHIVVASGTHLGIIVEFFKKRFWKISRFAGALFSLVFIFIFAQLVGWTASITRAVIVSGLSIVGWYFGRRFGGWRVILFAMAVTLLINPLYILDLGWQLSFTSFAGIMILAPVMTEFFFGKKDSKAGKIAELIIASVAATLMCAPILIYYFGTISLVSIVANVLILPTIPFAMGMTFLTGLVGFLPSFFLFDWLRFIVVKITTIIMDYHLFVMEFFSKQTSLILNLPKNNPLVFLLYVPILLPFVVFAIKKMQRKKMAREKVYENFAERLPFTVQS